MRVNKKKLEDFCEEFLYPFVILYGLEDAFLGVAEFHDDHKILLYDKEMIYCCFSRQGYPTDIIKEKFEKFFEFWQDLQNAEEGVFSGQSEQVIKRHLPALVTRFKDGVNPILKTVSYKEHPKGGEITIPLKEIIEGNEQSIDDIISEAGDQL